MFVAILIAIGVVTVGFLLVALGCYFFSKATINDQITNSIYIQNQFEAFRCEHNIKVISSRGSPVRGAPPPPSPPGPPKPPTNVVILRKKTPESPSDRTPRR